MSNLKIVQAANSMILHHEKITDVITGEYKSEFFFLYDGKYKWSVFKVHNENHYRLNYYPGNNSLKTMASWPNDAWQDFDNLVGYASKDIGTREALDTFRELHSIVQANVHGMKDVLDDIIGDIPF